jgi:hypothetical protein
MPADVWVNPGESAADSAPVATVNGRIAIAVRRN